MINLQSLKDVLMFKESATEAQNVFMEEFNDIYMEADREEQAFLENSVDQIFRKYYYSVVEPETYITPANIMSSLVERETDGETGDFVFFPKVILIKQKGVLSKIQSTLHYVNTERHHMTGDLETVLKICEKGLRVNEFGLPEDSERKKFKDRLFFNDRHYHNIIMLAAISLGYMEIVKEKNRYLAITTKKSDDFINMTMEDKIRRLADGIIESFIRASVMQIPQLKKILKNDTVWEIIKNPAKFSDFLEDINDEIGMSFDLIEKTIYGNKEGLDQLEQIQDLLLNNPSGFQLALFMVMLDMYLFTPLGYYMQLIKPFYSDVYNFVVEVGQAFNFLKNDYTTARNMLFAVPDEYDLTPLGEKIILDGKKSKRGQEIPKKYNEKKFLECFIIREQYIAEELLDFIGDSNQWHEHGDVHGDRHSDEYDDAYYNEDGDEYDGKYDNEYNGKNDFKDSAHNDSNVINLLDYKNKKGNNGKMKPGK